MNKILIAGLIAFTMVAVAGSAAAWYVDVEGQFWDAKVDIQLAVDGTNDEEEYDFTSTVGGNGNFGIDIEGNGYKDKLDTDVWTTCGGASIYATQTMFVTGCLEDCQTGEPCPDCPEYGYFAAQGATIDGYGSIDLDQKVDNKCNDHEQELDVWGYGTFTAGMLVAYQIEDCDPVVHAMGAMGTNVGFFASGETDFDENDGAADGSFITMMGFYDCPCPECGPECECGCIVK